MNTQDFLHYDKIPQTLSILVLTSDHGPAFLWGTKGVQQCVSREGRWLSNPSGHDSEVLLFAIAFPLGEHDSVIIFASGRE